ncbi:MAG: LamG domain-containing protein [Gammaproteobacteria bacterium]|nr:LamG domain-containing protein [Gammaproteobacteria bacterium]
MNRTLPVLLTLTCAFLGTSQALGQSSLKGQGRAFTGAGIFSVSADARGSRGGAGGSFRYDRKANGALEELVVVAVANCLWTSLDGTRAVVSGQAEVRSNPAGLATKEWFYIGIQDAGPAEKNRASAGFVSMAEGVDMCQTGLVSFPAMVDVGDFVITRNVGGSGAGGAGAGVAGGSTGATDPGNLTAPPFDGVLYLPFDGNASPGQIVTKPGAAPPTFVPGKYGQAIQLNDSSAVAVPFELNPADTPQITMTAWIKYSRRAGVGTILSTRGTGHPGLQVYGGRPKVVRGRAGRNAFVMTVGGSEIDMNTWTFIAGVFDYDSMTIQLHADGIPQLFDQDQRNDPLRMSLNSSDVGAQTEVVGPDGKRGYYLTIGATEFSRFGGVARGYAIDDVRIYTRALSEQAIANLAGQSGGGAAPNTAPSQYADIPVLGDPDPIGNANPWGTLARPGGSPTAGTPRLDDPRPTASDPADNLTIPGGITSPQEEYEAAAEAYRENAAREARQREREASDDEQARLQNEAEAARRDAEAAADTEPQLGEPYPMNVWNYSAIAGVSGSITRDADLGTSFMNEIAWDEVSDIPCRLEVSNTGQDENPTWARLTCPIPDTDRPTPRYRVSLPSAAIGRLSICSNNRANQRLKGIRVWGSTINADGSLTYSATDEVELNNCAEWSRSVLCPDNMSSTGIRVHANYRRGDKTEIVGLQLICRKIGLR